jgi:protease-4
MSTLRTVGRIAIVVAVALFLGGVGFGLFFVLPGGSLASLLGVVLALGALAGGLKLGLSLADSVLATYDVAEVEIDDAITRDGGSPGPIGLSGVAADDVVEQIEQADEDDAAEALVVKLNTPGGAVVPSEDIRRAAEQFDGPTVAYAEDMAASGGFWIASGCDRFHAREGSIVGSIGVTFAHLGRSGLAEKAGLNYRRLVAGEYKDTLSSQWRELREEEQEYFQGLIDDFYEHFVDTVAEGRELDEEFVRDTEARVYLGDDAGENGLVDTVGPREEMEADLADELGVDEITVETFEPEEGISDKLSMGASAVAYAFGAGVASAVLGDDDEPPVRVR